MKILRTLLPPLLVLALSASAGAEVYRWTDTDGKPHFGDKPPAGATGVESFQGKAAVSFMGGGNVSTVKSPSGKVRIFVTQTCPYCKKAKAYLQKRGTPFEELDVEASRSAKAEYDRLGGNGVPVILVGQQRMNGFDAGRLESLLVGSGL
ncbi:Glutaredoxin 3 [Methylococcales bacterium]|nr:Glutaredoxin 3 [Methylococcales bacterium]